MCDENTNQGTSNKSLSYWWLLGLAVAVICIQLCLWFWIVSIFGTGEQAWTQRGQFGDMFGAVNTLFSGLAFAGVIFAIILQSNELKLQREELALSREVNDKAAKAQADQAELLDRASKIKVLEMEIEVKVAMANMYIESVGATGDRGIQQVQMQQLSNQFPALQEQLESSVSVMKELAGIAAEPPESPTPQP